MFEIDVNEFKLPPKPKQLDGIRAIILNKAFALFDDMGSGKTKQTIDAACWLYKRGRIDTVIVLAPAQVKSVWTDPDLGEVVKHGWVRARIFEYKLDSFDIPYDKDRLMWVVASYELLRQTARLDYLIRQLRGRHILVVADESSFISNWKAKQTKSAMILRAHCERAVVLNGTPGEPANWFSQYAFLDKAIIGAKNFYAFRARYCKMGGFKQRQIVGYQNIEELQARTRRVTLRRPKEEFYDYLKPKIHQFREIALSESTWAIYKQMREEAVVYLKNQSSMAPHAITKMLRLGQLTSGILGGLCNDDGEVQNAEQISQEKIDAFVEWAGRQISSGQNRIIVWCRFNPEMDCLRQALREVPAAVFEIRGGQSKKARNEAKMEFQAGDPSKPAILIGQAQAGGLGLTLTTAYTVAYLSNDYSLKNRLQSEDRVHRGGQYQQCVYTDFIATGPRGQKTVDRAILKAIRNKEEIASWSASKWRKELSEE